MGVIRRTHPPMLLPAQQPMAEHRSLLFFPAIQPALGTPQSLLFSHSVDGAMAIVIAALHSEGCEEVIG